MRTFVIAAAATATLAATPVAAQSLFDGNWKGNPAAAKLDPRPDVWTLKDGSYSCTSCVPAYTVPADGQFHAIAGHPYADEVSIAVVDATAITERDRKGGKVMAESTTTVSADGNTITTAWKDFSAPNGQLMTGTGYETRVAPAPAGAHATSGSWRSSGTPTMSDSALLFTIATKGDHFRYSDPTGTSFEGRYGGPFTPIVGDPAHAMSKVERISATQIRETQTVDGKVRMIADISVSPDGKTLTNVVHDQVHGTTNTIYATKQ